MIYLFGDKAFNSARFAAIEATSAFDFRDFERALLNAKPGDIVYSDRYNNGVTVLSGVTTSC